MPSATTNEAIDPEKKTEADSSWSFPAKTVKPNLSQEQTEEKVLDNPSDQENAKVKVDPEEKKEGGNSNVWLESLDKKRIKQAHETTSITDFYKQLREAKNKKTTESHKNQDSLSLN